MALIPEDPKQRNPLIVAILVAVGFYFFWSMWYSPRNIQINGDEIEEVEGLAPRLERLQDRNALARITATRGAAELQARLEEYERHVRRLEELIPSSEEVASLISGMASEARRAGVELSSIDPEPGEDVGIYTREAYELGVIGDYHDIGRFLTTIASMPRIITPVDLELEPFSGDPSNLSINPRYPLLARLRILTYIVPHAPPPPAGGAGGQGG